MTNPLRWNFVAACFIGALFAGCTPPPAFQIETVIHPGGSCDRMIWQPKEKFLPDGALTPEWNARWKTVADAPERPGGSGSKASTDEFTYFVARGSFGSPQVLFGR
jgi:hypothetical protein